MGMHSHPLIEMEVVYLEDKGQKSKDFRIAIEYHLGKRHELIIELNTKHKYSYQDQQVIRPHFRF